MDVKSFVTYIDGFTAKVNLSSSDKGHVRRQPFTFKLSQVFFVHALRARGAGGRDNGATVAPAVAPAVADAVAATVAAAVAAAVSPARGRDAPLVALVIACRRLFVGGASVPDGRRVPGRRGGRQSGGAAQVLGLSLGGLLLAVLAPTLHLGFEPQPVAVVAARSVGHAARSVAKLFFTKSIKIFFAETSRDQDHFSVCTNTCHHLHRSQYYYYFSSLRLQSGKRSRPLKGHRFCQRVGSEQELRNRIKTKISRIFFFYFSNKATVFLSLYWCQRPTADSASTQTLTEEQRLLPERSMHHALSLTLSLSPEQLLLNAGLIRFAES
jgi:hypothetical protein